VINPFTALEVTTTSATTATGLSSNCEKEADKWMCLYILAINRLIKVNVPSYLDMLVTKADIQLKACGAPGNITMAGASSTYNSWENDPSYRKWVAGIDMFFYRNQESE
jgi:hydrogenase maturation factor